jgi:hypothetical protein
MLPLANPTISRPARRVQHQLQRRSAVLALDPLQAGPCDAAQGGRWFRQGRLTLDSPLKKGYGRNWWRI